MGKETRTREEQIADRQAKLDVLHEKLTDAVEALVTGEDWQRAVAFAARFRRYSFGNSLLLMQQSLAAYERGLLPEPYPRFVAGYRAWQSLGRQVRSGSRGFQILAPQTSKVAIADDGSWRRLGKGEQPGPGETATTRMTGVRPTTVFPAEFTDGDTPLPETPAPQLLQGEAPPGLWDGLATLIRAKGFTLADVPDAAALGGANGVTRWGPNDILVRADMDPAARARTLAHESGHLYAHDPTDPDVPAHRGLAEIEAESISAFVMAAHGVDSSAYTVPYVSVWASRVDGVDPVTAVQQTATRVRTVALQILEGLDTQQVPDGDPPGLVRAAGPERGTSATSPTVPANPGGAASSGNLAGPDDGLASLELSGRHAASSASNDGLVR